MQIILSNSDKRPIYEQITAQVKNQILNGALGPDEALPSIRQLAKDLRISVITTKRAYEDLERDGFIQTIPGKGSFVSPKNTDLLREERLKQAEEHLARAVETAKASGIPLGELLEILRILYEGTL